jgi:hypothetical protein
MAGRAPNYNSLVDVTLSVAWPDARQYHGAAVMPNPYPGLDAVLLVFGGLSESGYLNDLWVYAPEERFWVNLATQT